jgi:hypothetical protein
MQLASHFHKLQLYLFKALCFSQARENPEERVIGVDIVETVKLAQIVMKWFPDMLPFFNHKELNSTIVLRDGLTILEQNDAMEIIQFSICRHQDGAYLH